MIDHVVKLVVDVCTVLYSLSVVFFIWRTRRTDKQFASSFFSLYALVNFNLGVWTAWTCMLSPMLAWVSLDNLFATYVPCQVHAIGEFFVIIHASTQAAIAANRFSCFCTSSIHEFLWSGRSFKSVIFVIFAIPAAQAIYSATSPCYYLLDNLRLSSMLWTQTSKGESRLSVLASALRVRSSVSPSASLLPYNFTG